MNIYIPDIFLGENPTRDRNVEWTEAEDATLRQRVSEKAPYRAIAAELGRTRNSAIGRAKRLGLISLNPPSKPGDPAKAKAAAKAFIKNRNVVVAKREPEPPPLPPIAPAESVREEEYIAGTGLPLLDLEPHHCRWPLNDPGKGGQYFFCGEDKHEDCAPYCKEHTKQSRGCYGRF